MIVSKSFARSAATADKTSRTGLQQVLRMAERKMPRVPRKDARMLRVTGTKVTKEKDHSSLSRIGVSKGGKQGGQGQWDAKGGKG